MITMEVFYCKFEKEEKTFNTWNYDNVSGWTKQAVPNFISTEEKIANEWFKISNEEDLIFLRKEQTAFENWRRNMQDEIYISLFNVNKKM